MKSAGCVVFATAFCMLGSGHAQSRDESRRELLNPLASTDPATLQGFLGRPLFSPSRRPPSAPATLPASTSLSAPVSPPPALRLVGIIRTPKESIAQIVRDADNQRLSLRVGDFMDDWAVSSIDASIVTLKQGDREARFSIFARNAQAGRQEGEPTMLVAPTASSPNKAASPRRRIWTKEEVESFFGK